MSDLINITTSPFALVLDFSRSLKQSNNLQTLKPEIAWILYDKINQSVVRRARYPINFDQERTAEARYQSEFVLSEMNNVMESYNFPELIVEDRQDTFKVNRNFFNPNILIQELDVFSVLDDYREKSELPCQSLEEVLYRKDILAKPDQIQDLSLRADYLLEYYKDSQAKKERQQPYSQPIRRLAPDQRQSSSGLVDYLMGFFTTLLLLGCLALIFTQQQLFQIVYLLLVAVVMMIVFKALRKSR